MASCPTSRSRVAEAGIALIAVMWTVTFLVLLALVFSNSVQIETRSAIYHKEAAQASALARGGIEAAILEIAYTPVGEPQRSPLWTWENGQREGTLRFQAGNAKVWIVDESGKLDLNVAGREQLRRLFEARGLESTAAARLAEAIIHWRSPVAVDDPESAALEDYYNGAGYPAAHAPFTSVEQVLLVRGMTRELFYGTVEVTAQGTIRPKYGLGLDLTVFSGSAQVNVNYASEPVLLSVPGGTPEVAQDILQERRQGPFRSVGEMKDRLAEFVPDESLPFLTTGESKTYSIISEGELEGSQVRRTVRAVVQVAPQGTAQHRILAWYDDEVSG
jgi:general secretion pathway protein K